MRTREIFGFQNRELVQLGEFPIRDFPNRELSQLRGSPIGGTPFYWGKSPIGDLPIGELSNRVVPSIRMIFADDPNWGWFPTWGYMLVHT